ncbi:Nif3-like dinuclear metal center hexameric protein [Alkalihalobacillus sp. AL-G]|uniref:Nif3-like dinuclear metal center hexameric protein n=1 Tax=Alkalihalobacillus sp. AL-G TaxID=2926399 RepID=UPI00272D1EB3|nr:Nif3-like dinuclear metal center hexameric protein [Alkalihalobacillus sp. AL-G]WLD94703.1 Nif3-like dinuclear metal center hexameric protein [Alkalihalobacillus sp. AL-G]
MENMVKVKQLLDSLFNIIELDRDPGFSRFIPQVYDPIKVDWTQYFEADFSKRFNGLMMKGSDQMNTVFLAVFPTDQVLESFINEASEGDLLFLHHPLVMECGDPRGEWGRGFVPIRKSLLQSLKDKKLSVYTCHTPLDYHLEISTNMAIANVMNALVIDRFIYEEGKSIGLICDVEPIDTAGLIKKLESIFEIPYVDFEGEQHNFIDRIAIVAGCGDKVAFMREAESFGVQAYVTGEIHCHIDNDYGRAKYKQMMDYVPESTMSLIGVSHSASEYMVMQTQMKNWFTDKMDVNVRLLPQHKWWL